MVSLLDPRQSPETSPRSSPTPIPPRPLMKEDVIDVEDLNFNEGFAGDVIQTILRRAQRDQQTLNNLRKTKKIGSDFTSSMKSSTKWTAGIIFDKGKCYLDEEVLELAKAAKEKKQNKFWNQVVSAVKIYNKMKHEYTESMKKLVAADKMKLNNLPIWVLYPLCKWKRRKGDENMPTLRMKLLERWKETKDRDNISFEQYLKSFTSLFETFQKTNGGKVLTIGMIDDHMKEYHDVGIGRATPIVHTPTATNDDCAVAV